MKLITITELEILGIRYDERNTLILRLNVPVFQGDDIAPHHFARRWIGFFETKNGNHYLANSDKNGFAYIITIETVERFIQRGR